MIALSQGKKCAELTIVEVGTLITTLQILIGTKTKLGKTEAVIFCDAFNTTYGAYTNDEIKLAFTLACEQKLNCNIENYPEFSMLLISKIMKAYEVYRREDVQYKEYKTLVQKKLTSKQDKINAINTQLNDINRKFATYKSLLHWLSLKDKPEMNVITFAGWYDLLVEFKVISNNYKKFGDAETRIELIRTEKKYAKATSNQELDALATMMDKIINKDAISIQWAAKKEAFEKCLDASTRKSIKNLPNSTLWQELIKQYTSLNKELSKLRNFK